MGIMIKKLQTTTNHYIETVREHFQWSSDWNGTDARIGRYLFVYNRHDTAEHLKIWAIDDDAGDSLLIYREDAWISSCYDFNNDGTIQGFQSDGPWVEQVDRIIARMAEETAHDAAVKDHEKANQQQIESDRAAAKLEKFRSLFSSTQGQSER